MPAHEAEYFTHSVRAGELLVSVMVDDAMANRAVSLLEHHRSQDGDWETAEQHRPAITAEKGAVLDANLSKVNSQVARFPPEAQAGEPQGTHAEIGAPPRMVVEVVVRYEGEHSQSAADPKSTSGAEVEQPAAELARVLSDIDLRRLLPEKLNSLKGKPLV